MPRRSRKSQIFTCLLWSVTFPLSCVVLFFEASRWPKEQTVDRISKVNIYDWPASSLSPAHSPACLTRFSLIRCFGHPTAALCHPAPALHSPPNRCLFRSFSPLNRCPGRAVFSAILGLVSLLFFIFFPPLRFNQSLFYCFFFFHVLGYSSGFFFSHFLMFLVCSCLI